MKESVRQDLMSFNELYGAKITYLGFYYPRGEDGKEVVDVFDINQKKMFSLDGDTGVIL